MSETELAEIESQWLRPGGIVTCDIPTMGRLLEDMRRLIAEVRDLRETVEDNAVFYLSPEERQKAQMRYNVLFRQMVDELSKTPAAPFITEAKP